MDLERYSDSELSLLTNGMSTHVNTSLGFVLPQDVWVKEEGLRCWLIK